MVIMTMVIFVLIFDYPFLANCIIRLLGNEILARYDFILDYIKCISSEGIFKTFCTDIVFKSLVVEASPFVRNDIFVKSFEKCCSRDTNTYKALVIITPGPLLSFVWMLSARPFLQFDVVNAGRPWSVEIGCINCQGHLISI